MTKRKTGRPTKGALKDDWATLARDVYSQRAVARSQRVGMSLRVTPEMKERLEQTALETGRSLSQEAEIRLERTFRDQELLPQLMAATYGEKLAAVLMIVGTAMAESGRTVGFNETRTPEGAAEWIDRPVAFDQAVKAAQAVLQAVAPDGDVRPQRGTPMLPLLLLGDSYAKTYLHVATGSLSMPTRGRWAEVVRTMLGSDLIGRIKKRSGA